MLELPLPADELEELFALPLQAASTRVIANARASAAKVFMDFICPPFRSISSCPFHPTKTTRLFGGFDASGISREHDWRAKSV